MVLLIGRFGWIAGLRQRGHHLHSIVSSQLAILRSGCSQIVAVFPPQDVKSFSLTPIRKSA